MMRIVALVCGIVAVLLGGLWLLQGLGIVQLRPILCFADCVPIQGPSVTWAVGGFGIAWSRRRPSSSPILTQPGSK